MAVEFTLERVLAHVERGRVIHLELSPEQKRALRDPQGQIALDVLRHMLAARESAAGGAVPSRFPLAELAVQATAAKIGHRVGQKRSRALVRRLVEAGVTAPAGSYRQPYTDSETRDGYHVRLFRLTVKIVRATAFAVATAFGKIDSPVGSRPSVKGRRGPYPKPRWWQHELFGCPTGRPPPQLARDVAKRMRSLDELPSEAARVAALMAA